MTHWKRLVNPSYIGAYSLDDGKDLNVTFVSVGVEKVKNMDGKDEDCVVAQLVGQKPFIMNKTNLKQTEKVLGTPDVDKWAGQSVTLYVARVRAFGDNHEVLRIRPTKPNTVKALPELTPADAANWDKAKTAIKAGTSTVEKIRKHYTLSDANAAKLTQP